MKTSSKNLFPSLGEASRAAWACLGEASARSRVLPALIAGLGFLSSGQLTAQTFTTLYTFTAYSNGAYPSGLILSGKTLYGPAGGGGSFGNGTVFKVNTDGTGFTNLHSFAALSGPDPDYPTNSDGSDPKRGMILSGNTLYGTASHGGSSGHGTVFKVNTDGTGFTTLHSFLGDPSDGAVPEGGLLLSGNTLYGTATGIGSFGNGTVFAINTDGAGFTNLYSFTANSDGIHPIGRLILSGNTLYGIAAVGGISGAGTVFKVNADGTGFTNLHSFTANSDGADPQGGLILSGNTLYGTASQGGSSGNGTVFAVNTDGSGFAILHSFTETPPYPNHTNSDGAIPYELILSGNTLYGAALQGGSFQNGTVFGVNTDGTGFTNLHSFTATPSHTNSDGAGPSGLILSGNTLYGTATQGGSSGIGTIFSLSLGSVSAPQLTIIRSGANVILTWPTNAAGFTLQSTTNLVSSAFWSTVSPGPVLINGQNTVTNATAEPPEVLPAKPVARRTQMIPRCDKLFLLPALTAGLGLLPSSPLPAQILTTLHNFTGRNGGAHPNGGLVLTGNTLYGTATDGGMFSNDGAVFRVNTNGTGITSLRSFNSDANDAGYYPVAGLILSGNTLYGTTYDSEQGGAVFAVHTDGTGFTTLYDSTIGDDRGSRRAGLVLAGYTLYGTAEIGFKANTEGTGFTNRYDDVFSLAGLILSGNTLYGTAEIGGTSGSGTVFTVNTDGTGFTILHSFTATGCDDCPNSDGAFPAAGLILSGSTLYGTTTRGGTSSCGTVFSLSLPPHLKIITSGANAVLTWPTNTAGFTLQSTTNLVSPVVWTTVSPGPVAVNGQNTVTNAAAGARKFCRLSQ